MAAQGVGAFINSAMCGRYSLATLPPNLEHAFPEAEWTPRYNLAPTQSCPVLTQEAPDTLQAYRWGLVPRWARDLGMGARMINARSETVWDKPTFKGPVRNTRCLVPADGFYEWKRTPEGKQPFRIRPTADAYLWFAGIYDRWQGKEGQWIPTFSILTTEPNALMASLHDRMPVILGEAARKRWLDAAASREELDELLQPYPADALEAYPVSPQVGNVRNDHKGLIQPYEPPPTLF